jgi:hypothetical protein
MNSTVFPRDLLQLTFSAQVRMNAIHMIIAIAQLGHSQMRHMVKYVHSSLCQLFYNCMTGSSAHLLGAEQGSEELTEMTLVILIHVAPEIRQWPRF